MAAHWQSRTDGLEITQYMSATPKLVAPRTLAEAEWDHTEVTADIVGQLTRRKGLNDRPIYVFGSADLSATLLEAGLVDELLIGIARVTLGAGTPCATPPPGRVRSPCWSPAPLTAEACCCAIRPDGVRSPARATGDGARTRLQ